MHTYPMCRAGLGAHVLISLLSGRPTQRVALWQLYMGARARARSPHLHPFDFSG